MSYLDSLLSTGETVQVVARQHPIVLLRSVLVNGLLVAVLLLLAGFAPRVSESYAPVMRTVLLLALVVPLGLLARDLAHWTARQYVVTTRRVLELGGVLSRHVSDSNLDKVNDLVLHQSVLGRALGYGDIEIITGSDVGLNRLERIGDPIGFQRAMLDNKEDLDSLSRVRGRGPGDVADALERLADLRDRGALTDEEFARQKAEILGES